MAVAAIAVLVAIAAYLGVFNLNVQTGGHTATTTAQQTSQGYSTPILVKAIAQPVQGAQALSIGYSSIKVQTSKGISTASNGGSLDMQGLANNTMVVGGLGASANGTIDYISINATTASGSRNGVGFSAPFVQPVFSIPVSGQSSSAALAAVAAFIVSSYSVGSVDNFAIASGRAAYVPYSGSSQLGSISGVTAGEASALNGSSLNISGVYINTSTSSKEPIYLTLENDGKSAVRIYAILVYANLTYANVTTYTGGSAIITKSTRFNIANITNSSARNDTGIEYNAQSIIKSNMLDLVIVNGSLVVPTGESDFAGSPLAPGASMSLAMQNGFLIGKRIRIPLPGNEQYTILVIGSGGNIAAKQITV